ncbi:MAG: diguanylate cyclase [Rhodoferax sp.]|nr:diguanylate cyclase [Rhodoferax sp.]
MGVLNRPSGSSAPMACKSVVLRNTSAARLTRIPAAIHTGVSLRRRGIRRRPEQRQPAYRPADRRTHSRIGRKNRFPLENQHISVTISIGVALATGSESDSLALIQSADAALYQAKERGWNRVVAG